jgi:hypothetical protein
VHGVHDAIPRVVVSINTIIDALKQGRGHDVVNVREVRQRGDAKGVSESAKNGRSIRSNLK